MTFLQEVIVFFLSTGYIIFLDHIASSPRSLQRALALIVIVLFLSIYKASRNSWQDLTTGFGKLVFLFWTTISVELLVLSTGGLQSPFLILIHLLMIAISFIFSFILSLVFLVSCSIIFFLSVSAVSHIGMVIPQIASLIAIIPLAYIISRQYHLKDAVMNTLTNKIKTTEAIIKNLPELIIVTDQNFTILSTNDAAAQTFQRSHAELLNKPLFDILLLKDKNNKLVTAETLFPDGKEKPQTITDEFLLFQSPIVTKNVKVKIQITESAKNLKQISFIISFRSANKHETAVSIDKARAKYEALFENIKQKLSPEHVTDIKTDLVFLEKIENDTYMLQNLKNILQTRPASYIDLAKACKQIVQFNKSFTDGLGIHTAASLPNFGAKDIAPLTVENYHVDPEQLTGPFFTVLCDAKQIEMLIKKLFDLTVLLASGTTNPSVTLATERGEKETILISVKGTCPPITNDELKFLFVPYYGTLAEKTNLFRGSGLEGFLVKHIVDTQRIVVSTNYTRELSEISFQLSIHKTQKNHRRTELE